MQRKCRSSKIILNSIFGTPIGRVQGQACICQLCIPGAKLTSPQYTRKIYLKMVILDRIRLPEEIPMNTNYPFLCSFIKKSGKIKMAFSPLFSIFLHSCIQSFFPKTTNVFKNYAFCNILQFLTPRNFAIDLFSPRSFPTIGPLESEITK